MRDGAAVPDANLRLCRWLRHLECPGSGCAGGAGLRLNCPQPEKPAVAAFAASVPMNGTIACRWTFGRRPGSSLRLVGTR